MSKDQVRIDREAAALRLASQLRPGLSRGDNPSLFVSDEDIAELTRKTRYSAQAKFLAKRGYKFEVRDDGSIALRLGELDAHTLSTPPRPNKKRTAWKLDLSSMDKDRQERGARRNQRRTTPG